MEEKKMEKCISGAVFCLAAAVLESSKYISAAVYMSGNTSQGKELFSDGLQYIGAGPDIMAALALAAGVLLVTWGLIEANRRK